MVRSRQYSTLVKYVWETSRYPVCLLLSPCRCELAVIILSDNYRLSLPAAIPPDVCRMGNVKRADKAVGGNR